MRLELTDMTKEELIKIIRQSFQQPTVRQLLWIRWESLTAEASRIRRQAIEESKKYEGIRTYEALSAWSDAQRLFDKGMVLDKKADEIFAEYNAIEKGSPAPSPDSERVKP